MNKDLVYTLTDKYIDKTVQVIYQSINSPVELLNKVCTHLIANGGKRVRPRLMILTAGLIGGEKHIDNDELINMSAMTEILHTSTLMHDDVIDMSEKRRGVDSTNIAFSNTLAVLGGDYLFTKIFLAINKIKDINQRIKITEVFSGTLSDLVEGEIEQLQNISDKKLSEEKYFKVIHSKTSVLFEICTIVPGILANLSDEKIKALKIFANCLGNAFQITDDILDYTASIDEMGKNAGDDLNEEKITLPIIYLINNAEAQNKDDLKDIEKAISEHDIVKIKYYLNKYNTIEQTKQRAEQEVLEAYKQLDLFDDSEYKTALKQLAQMIINRSN